MLYLLDILMVKNQIVLMLRTLYLNYGTGHDVFIGNDTTSGSDLFVTNGNIGIGTHDTKGYLLAVAGKAVAEEVKIMRYKVIGLTLFLRKNISSLH